MQGLTSTSTVANPVPNPDQVLSPLVISTIGAHLTLTSLLPHPLPPPGSTQLAEAAAGAAVGGTSPIGRSCIEAGAGPPDELCWRLEALRSLQERLAAAPLSSSRGRTPTCGLDPRPSQSPPRLTRSGPLRRNRPQPLRHPRGQCGGAGAAAAQHVVSALPRSPPHLPVSSARALRGLPTAGSSQAMSMTTTTRR